MYLATKDCVKTVHQWKTLVLLCGYPVHGHLQPSRKEMTVRVVHGDWGRVSSINNF